MCLLAICKLKWFMTGDWKMTASQFQNSLWCRTKGNISQSFVFLSSSEIAFHEWYIWWQLNLDQAVPPLLCRPIFVCTGAQFWRLSHPLSLSLLPPCLPPASDWINTQTDAKHMLPAPSSSLLHSALLAEHRGGAFSCRRLVFAYSETDVNLASALSVRLVGYSAFPLDAPEFPLRDTRYKLDLIVNN